MKRYEKIDPHQNHARSGETSQTPGQETPQTTSSGASLPGELAKYDALSKELAGNVRALAGLHEQRANFEAKSATLKAGHAELEQKVLDGSHEAIADLVLNHDAVTLNDVKLSALSVRIEKLEVQLHERVPLALTTFQTLRQFVTTSVLESCRGAVRSLIDPSAFVDQVHVDALALCMGPYVKASRITVPAPSFAFTRSLTPEKSWSTLTRPFTSAEERAYRSETIGALVAAANALCSSAKSLIEAAGPYADRCPPFKCEPEVVEPAVVDPKFLEWQSVLNGSDEQFAKEVCATAGKAYPPEGEADQRILSEMIQARRQMPVAYGTVSGEMLGSTQPV